MEKSTELLRSARDLLSQRALTHEMMARDTTDSLPDLPELDEMAAGFYRGLAGFLDQLIRIVDRS